MLRLGPHARPTQERAVLLVIIAAFSVQFGAALATGLFGSVGVLGAVFLRVGFAALVLVALAPTAFREARGRPLRWVIALGVTLAVMNSLFYLAIDRIPLKVAVTVEFLGPLAVAVAGSRRPLDFVWVALAGAGIALFGSPTLDVDRLGLVFAAGAAVCWALYIVFAKRLAATWSIRGGLTASMALAAVLLIPVGVVSAGGEFFDPLVLVIGIGVALLSSVIPYGLEFAALRRLKASTFGILLSLEPAIAAIVGAVILTQVPTRLEALAIALVVIASIGASWTTEALPPEA